ncbi:MAG: hypothetical protein V1901_04175 [Patescibacteria group bacterium]
MRTKIELMADEVLAVIHKYDKEIIEELKYNTIFIMDKPNTKNEHHIKIIK